MATVGELIQRVQFTYNGKIQKDRNPLRNRLIYSALISSKNLLMFQKINKKQSIAPYNYKTIACVKLVKAPLYDCPCVPPVGCTFLKSEYPLPDVVGGIGNAIDLEVTSLDNNLNFTYITPERIKYISYSKYNKHINYFLIIDKYLYVLSKNAGRLVAVTGLFEDFVEVENYPGLCNTCEDCEPCKSSMEIEFPISKELEQVLVDMAVTELLKTRNINESKE